MAATGQGGASQAKKQKEEGMKTNVSPNIPTYIDKRGVNTFGQTK